MAGQKDQLTLKQDRFARLVVEEGASFVAAYRLIYPPRIGKRSSVAERVAARRVAHHPLVEQRMEELRKQLRAGDPAELRRRANAVLGRILAEQLDPKYRRNAASLSAISTTKSAVWRRHNGRPFEPLWPSSHFSMPSMG